MKIARLVLKFVALGLVVAAGICAIIAYWDKLIALFGGTAQAVREKAAAYNPEYDDYEVE